MKKLIPNSLLQKKLLTTYKETKKIAQLGYLLYTLIEL